MTHDYWICGTLISTELSLWKIPNHLWKLFVYMYEKQILMQEWICVKCPHTSNAEGDQYFTSQHAWAMFRHGCQRHSFLNSQTDSRMYTFPDQMNWQFVQILMDSQFQSKLRVLDTDDVKQKDFFVFCSGKICWVCFHGYLFFCFMSSVSGTQNKCPNSHHSHTVHLFNT